MRIGAISHEGYTITARLGSQDVELVLRMQDHEAASLVSALLLTLASIDPLRWDETYKTVREIMRIPDLRIR